MMSASRQKTSWCCKINITTHTHLHKHKLHLIYLHTWAHTGSLFWCSKWDVLLNRALSLHSFLFPILCLGGGCYTVSARLHVYLYVLKINIPGQSNQRLNFLYGANESQMILCISEISNLLVMTRDREPAPQRQPQVSQLSFHRILKEEIVQVIFSWIFIQTYCRLFVWPACKK